MRNKEMTIMKALGIFAVVMGHTPLRIGGAFDSYSFHMALFIFISGYFYKVQYEDNIGLFIKKRAKSILIPYFLYNVFYLVVTKLLFKLGGIDFGQTTTFKSFFIQPFINGHQYLLFLAAWFVLQLLIIQIVYVLLFKYLRKFVINPYIQLLAFFLLGLFGVFLSKKIPMQNINLILVRTLFGLFFFHLGGFYKNNLEKKNIFKFSILLVVIGLQIYLSMNYDIVIELVWGVFHSGYIVPFLTCINGIYLYLFISKGLAHIIGEKDLLLDIGNNTFHVMANHIFVFFILNFIFIKVNHLDTSLLRDIWFKHEIYRMWPIYLCAGVIVPTYVAILIRKILCKVKPIVYNRIISLKPNTSKEMFSK